MDAANAEYKEALSQAGGCVQASEDLTQKLTARFCREPAQGTRDGVGTGIGRRGLCGVAPSCIAGMSVVAVIIILHCPSPVIEHRSIAIWRLTGPRSQQEYGRFLRSTYQ
jgi:hypothetical protein